MVSELDDEEELVAGRFPDAAGAASDVEGLELVSFLKKLFDPGEVLSGSGEETVLFLSFSAKLFKPGEVFSGSVVETPSLHSS